MQTKNTIILALLGFAASAYARVVPLSDATLEKRQSADCSSFWLENINSTGVAPYAGANYTVFRNVKMMGAVGDGVTDDTAAINNAISAGGRSSPASGMTTTTTPALVYFPNGTYLVNASIIDYFYTQLIGNAICPPTIKAASSFTGAAVLDGDVNNGVEAVNIFFHQLRNFVFDITQAPASVKYAISWGTGQASSIQNVAINMKTSANNGQTGIASPGSGQWMTDVTFNGGSIGLNQGNQQYTMRNLTFNGCATAIKATFDWGWTYQNIQINNAQVGIDITGAAATTIVDSSINNTPIGIRTFNGNIGGNVANGSVLLENVQFNNVSKGALVGPTNNVIVAGGTTTVAGYAYGHRYSGLVKAASSSGTITPNTRPASLTGPNGFYSQSKPQYETLPVSSFASAKSAGVIGDGVTDVTSALQSVINNAAAAGKVLYLEQGVYVVTNTITLPPGSRIVGEAYPVIISSGSLFNNAKVPKAVVAVGAQGSSGTVQWSDIIVATRGTGTGTGGQAGAILIRWNMAAPAGAPSGAWDVHARIGGAVGTGFNSSTCPTTPGTKATAANIPRHCISAFLGMWLTPAASGVYLENNWIWSADHDIDGPAANGGNRFTSFSGRGTLVQSQGPVWMWGHASEHHQLYQYQFSNAANIYAGQLQTETPYYQPNPNATLPFATNTAFGDPTFPTTKYTSTSPKGVNVPNAEAWGLRVVKSSDILFYGGGFYSFFNNYKDTPCAAAHTCQSRIVSIEQSTGISLYDLHTVGTQQMLTTNGKDGAYWTANDGGFSSNIILFRTVS